MRLCFLVSQNGGNLKFFYLLKQMGVIVDDVSFMVVSHKNCPAISFAKNVGLQHEIVNYSRSNNRELLQLLKNYQPDIIVTTWDRILDKEIVREFWRKAINLHYSLLPAFKKLIGIKPIEEAYMANCKYIGVTCHFVEEEVDSGLIISQAIVRNDKPINYIIEDIFRLGCLILLNSILIVEKGKRILKQEYYKKTPLFHINPDLLFNPGIFSEDFWRDLRKL